MNSPPISTADRDKAKELCAKATDGWHLLARPKDQPPPIVVDAAEATVAVVGHGNDIKAKTIADFIAFARTAIPSYEARVVELEAALSHEQRIGAGLILDLSREEDRAEASEARATALLEALRKIDATIHASAGMTTMVDGLDISALIRAAIAAKQNRQTEG